MRKSQSSVVVRNQVRAITSRPVEIPKASVPVEDALRTNLRGIPNNCHDKLGECKKSLEVFENQFNDWLKTPNDLNVDLLISYFSRLLFAVRVVQLEKMFGSFDDINFEQESSSDLLGQGYEAEANTKTRNKKRRVNKLKKKLGAIKVNNKLILPANGLKKPRRVGGVRTVRPSGPSMQSSGTISSQLRGKVSKDSMEGILSICMPGEEPVCRIPAEVDLKETATARPFSIQNQDWSSASGRSFGSTKANFILGKDGKALRDSNGQRIHDTSLPAVNQLGNNETLCVIQRLAECSRILYYANEGSAEYSYIANYLSTAEETVDALLPSVLWDMFLIPGERSNLKIAFWSYNSVGGSTFAPHGLVQLCATPDGDQTDDRRFIWIDAGCSIGLSFVASADTLNLEFTLALDKYSANGVEQNAQFGQVDSGTSAGATKSVNITVDESGYYSLAVSAQPNANDVTPNTTTSYTIGSMAVSYAGTHSTFGHTPSTDFLKNAPSIESYRVIGSSLMYTNNAAPINREGKYAILQFPVLRRWNDFIGQYQNVASSNGSARDDVENGVYGWLKPAGEDTFKYATYVSYDVNANLLDSYWPLKQKSPSMIIYLQIETVAGRSGYWTTKQAIEYTTTDVWRETEYTSATKVPFDAALQELRFVPQFHANASHISDIVSSIKNVLDKGVSGIGKVAGFVQKYASPVMGLLSGASQLLG